MLMRYGDAGPSLPWGGRFPAAFFHSNAPVNMKRLLPLLLVLSLSGATYAQSAEDAIRMGKASISAQEYSLAISYFGLAIELLPTQAEAYLHRGMIYCQLGDYLRCNADLSKAAALDPALIRRLRSEPGSANEDEMEALPPPTL
jgi:tetratricopeptide (TPR) repeat protein